MRNDPNDSKTQRTRRLVLDLLRERQRAEWEERLHG